MTTLASPARGLLAAVLVLSPVLGAGCGSKSSDNTTNPELKVPDVPPGRGANGAGMAPGKDVKAKK